MKANIKMAPWIPLIFIMVSVIFSLQEFNTLDVILIVTTVFIVVYYALGYLRRKDAIVVTSEKLIVRTPFVLREYLLDDLKEITLTDKETVLRGLYQGEHKTLVTNIYDVSLHEIKNHLLTSHPIINDMTDRKDDINGQ